VDSDRRAPAGADGDTSTLVTLRRLAIAVLVGSVLATVCDLLLRGALGAVSVDGSSGSTTWIRATVLSRLVWPIAATILYVAAAPLAATLEGSGVVPPMRTTPAAAARIAGVAMIAAPVGWVLASSIVRALTISINDAWASDGRIFAAPQFYSDIVVAGGPWILAGMALVTAAGHLHLGRR
jgi:hypothetical protein